jgi:serine phosphatase RsbU (regulator of sigma subunit)
MVQRIAEDVSRFTEGADQMDDITLLALRVF